MKVLCSTKDVWQCSISRFITFLTKTAFATLGVRPKVKEDLQRLQPVFTMRCNFMTQKK